MATKKQDFRHFSNPKTQRYIDELCVTYKYKEPYNVVSIHVYGNSSDLGCTEASTRKDIEVGVVVPDRLFSRTDKLRKLAEYLDGIRNGNTQVTAWISNEGGYKNPRKLKTVNAHRLARGEEPRNGQLGGWEDATYFLLDYKIVTGRTVVGNCILESDFLREQTKELPRSEVPIVVKIAHSDFHHGLVGPDYPRIAKGHIKLALAHALNTLPEHFPSMNSLRGDYPLINERNYHILAVQMLADTDRRYAELFDDEERSLLWTSRILREGSTFSDSRTPNYADYRKAVSRFFDNILNVMRPNDVPHLNDD